MNVDPYSSRTMYMGAEGTRRGTWAIYTDGLDVPTTEVLSNRFHRNIGQRFAGAGDFDGDGNLDLAISAYDNDNGFIDSGRVHVAYGPFATGVVDIEDLEQTVIYGSADFEKSDCVVAPGDVDGDGAADLLIGGGACGGAVFVFTGLGETGVLEPQQPRRPSRGMGLPWVGTSACMGATERRFVGVGDVSGDGAADVAIAGALPIPEMARRPMPSSSSVGWVSDPHPSLLTVLTACGQDASFTAIKTPEPSAEDTSAPPEAEVQDSAPPVEEDCPDLVYGAIELNVDESCKNDPPPTTRYTPVVEWEMRTYPTDPYIRASWYAPIVGQLTDDNGDGVISEEDTPDIVMGNMSYAEGGSVRGSTALRLISGDGSVQHWARTSWEHDGATWYPDGYMSSAIGDTDQDGHPEIYVMLHQNIDASNESWETCRMARLSAAGEIEALSPQDLECRPHAPALADMPGDGDIEVVAGTYVLSTDDLTVEAAPPDTGYIGTGYSASYWNGPIPAVVDLDDDGQMEVITGRHVQEADGTVRCYTDEDDSWAAAADINGDGYGELVLTGNNRIVVLDRECRPLAAWPIDDVGRGGPATIADYDGDGVPEIGVSAASNYLVYEVDGSLRWSWAVTDQSSNCTGSSVFDLEGDGYAEVLYADDTASGSSAGSTASR